MKIKSGLIKKLRIERNWSQEDLSEKSGLSLRTVQRIESGHNVSMESLKILSKTFEVSTDELLENENVGIKTPIEAIKKGFKEYANFSGKASRYEYWWFLLFIAMVMAIATIIHEKVGLIVDIILLLPLLSVGSRRLNDAGESVWWQLLMFVPFGQIPVFIVMAKPSKKNPQNE